MSDTDKVFAGSIPDIYDDYLVPLIFRDYAEDMARRVSETNPARVLETAAGSGVVTRALAPMLDADARYTITDLNQPMLDRAQRLQPADRRLVWQQADALALPFEDGSFDAVCCQFGVMFFPDRAKGFAEARRVLREGGTFVFNTWDRIEENVFADVVTEAAVAAHPHAPPRFLARTPHGYHDVEVIRRDMAAAGFAEPEIVTITAESRASGPEVPAIAYCKGTPLRNELVALDPEGLDDMTEMATEAVAEAFGTGAISGRIQAHIVIARR